MAININTFSPNTKAESTKVNENFVNIKTAIDQLQADKDVYDSVDLATVTFDINTSKIFRLLTTDDVGDNRILAVSNIVAGQSFIAGIVQGGTGSKTVTWWSGITWQGINSAPLLSTAVGAIDYFLFVCTGVGAYDGIRLNTLPINRAFSWYLDGTSVVADEVGMKYICPQDMTVIAIKAKTVSGTATIRLQKDAADIDAGISVTSSVSTETVITAPALETNQIITLDITAASSCVGLTVILECTQP